MNTIDHIQEDEIDLKELFKVIWNYKVFIVVFTAIVTLLSIVYTLTITPIYEVKSVVRIGFIGEDLVEQPKILEQKLRLVFDVENNHKSLQEKAWVSDISIIKGVDDFLQISTQSYSNDLALEQNKEVVAFLQNEYKYQIDEFALKTQTNIKNFEKQIDYINNVTKVNILRAIDKINNQDIVKIDEKIRLLKEQDLFKINERIRLLKEQDIFRINEKIRVLKEQDLLKIDEKINFIKTIEIHTIDNKIKFNETKLKEYENLLVDISKTKSIDNTQAMLMQMQILNTQNLILNLQNQIENLIKEKENIILLTLRDLEIEKKNLIDITLIDLENKRKNLIEISLGDLEIEKKNLIDITLRDLELQKTNLINDEIQNLNIKLNIDLEQKINDLQNQISFEELNFTNNRAVNSELVGNYIIKDNAIKPQKSLIIVVAFIIGFILSIFMVFIYNFVREKK
ncbi:MAG: Wzz/FepE/Etk N-terminal domain-containing protein [Arcobacteraceae bacterium]|nr:Wzz/FepE/Etk N-terminal domain-containing protein [Arcobacteraceae bacterium]